MPAALLALAGVLYLIASSSGAGWLYTIPAALVGVVLISAVGPLYSLRGIEVRRVSPATATAGRPLRCTLEVSNTGRLPRHLLEIQDTLAGGEGGIVVPRVRGGETLRVEYEIAGTRRGIYEGGEMLLASSAPFGLIYGRRRVGASSLVTVRPRPLDVEEPPTAPEIAGGDGEDGLPTAEAATSCGGRGSTVPETLCGSWPGAKAPAPCTPVSSRSPNSPSTVALLSPSS